MPSSTRRHRIARVLTVIGLGFVLTSSAWAQAVIAPRVVEFLPSAGAGLVSRYELEIVATGSGEPVERVKLGLPRADADGLIRVALPTSLSVAPAVGATYTARIVAVSPNGATVSTASNPFLFRNTPTAAADAAVPQTVQVATEPALQAAVAALTSGTTLVLAPGIYRLTAPLRIAGALTGVAITGATGRASDVVIEGAGMTTAGAAPTAITVTGRVEGLAVADLTIRQFAAHAITFARGPQAPRLTNLRLTDIGQAMITAAGVDDGLLEHASLDYTTTGISAAAAGIDLRGGHNWTVRLNAFRNVRGPVGVSAGAAVAASAGAADTTVTANLFVDCGRGIALGLTNVADGVDHTGGAVTNNVFTRAATIAGGAGIAITDSPDTVVSHNTVLTAQSAAPITYRFADSAHLTVANNLTDGALVASDGAWAIESGNVTSATPDMFVDAAAGDLHLRATASAAINAADASLAVATDIDGRGRDDNAPDAGADEVGATVSH